MSTGSEPKFWEGVILALSKIWPGVFGALIALKWQPEGATMLARATAAAGGFAASFYLTPALAELLAITSERIHGGLAFLIGLFGMAVVGEVVLTLRELQLAVIVRDFIRSVLRLDRRP